MRKNKKDSDNHSQTNSNYIAIRNWRADERPRERLIKHGADTLSDAELIAIILGSGAKGFSALDAAKALLDKHENLANLVSGDISSFKQIHGIGEAKAVSLAAALELSKRIQSTPFDKKNSIQSPEDIVSFYIPKLRGLRTEVFRVLLLNTANQIFREYIISEGSLNSSIVHPREVFRIAILESAAFIILLHNHPSGNCEPSKEDVTITKKLISTGKLIGIEVLDHIIIAGDAYKSMKNEGII